MIWLLSGVYLARFADRGWVPHDEGMLAQNAERTLQGELPHRDFDESYTGGLTFLHALAFRCFGTNLFSLRLVLFTFFLAFVPALYSVALRFLRPVAAGVVTLCAIAWSVPNYFASMPSWYVLFFATFGMLAILREVDTGRRRWLFIAGLCGGFSLLVIAVGLYFVAAGLLFLAFREQATAEDVRGVRRGLSAFFLLQFIFCLAFDLLVFFLVRSHLEPMEFLHFVAPSLAVTGLLLWRSWKEGGGPFPARLLALLRLTLPFGLGVLVPVLFFILAYFVQSALPDLYRGIFVLPRRQVEVARVFLPPLGAIRAAVPYALLLGFSRWIPRRRVWIVTLLVGGVLAVALLVSRSESVYSAIWQSARSLAVVATFLGCWKLAGSLKSRSLSPVRQQELFLLISVTAIVSLMQFPFPTPIYFCYVAPLVTLCLVAITNRDASAPHFGVLVFYFAFALVRMNPGYIFTLGSRYSLYKPLALLDQERASLRVPERERDEYEALVASIQRRSEGPFIFAAPDCPEVYFLSERRNPTGIIFDFLRPPIPPLELLRLLDEKRVKVVVINRSPGFSRRHPRLLAAALESPFPHSEEIGRFVVRWRD